MKAFLIILPLICQFSSFAQSELRLVFWDACREETLELPYQLWNVGIDSTRSALAGQTLEIDSGYYQVRASMTWNELRTEFHFDLVISNQLNGSDTLYLQKARLYGPTYLHAPSQEFKHYCCGELCEGKILDADPNGITRFTGRFREGVPVTNLKFFDGDGNRTKVEVYVGGNLKRIK